jgi:signal transduction histidine kinase
MKTQISLMHKNYRQLQYIGTSLILIFCYGLFISGLTMIFGALLFRDSPILIAITLFILAITLNPIRTWLQKYIDYKIFKINPSTYKDIQRFTNNLTTAQSLLSVSRLLREQIASLFNPTQIHIFLYDSISRCYKTSLIGSDNLEKNSSEIGFDLESDLVKTLKKTKVALNLEDSSYIGILQKIEQSKIALLGTSLLIPMHTQALLEGWIALGNQRGGVRYNQKQIDLLQELSENAALTVERVKVSSDLERRVSEMNVLTRVSQGINITLALDDMLELIYAQLSQIIQFSVFQVILQDQENNTLSYVFYVDEDERIIERENQIIVDNIGLDREVIDGQQPIVTEDYDEECQRRGVIPAVSDIYAWIGIPLNTGAEAIGLISIGSRQPSTTYSIDQINLLQSIADQTAGAMIKVKLLQEAERRTNQLRFLNEIIRNLSQTLEPKILLRRVLDSAIELINCKSGSIYLLDSDVDDLILIENSDNLNAYPHEIAGSTIDEYRREAIFSSKPIILSEKLTDEDRYGADYDLSDNLLINILIVPIQLKDHVIGIIEVSDRKDGLAFTKDDQELLLAFASQSAIAYENAQKYTFTDQSLAARLEELSVMQRIDRELNTNLDVTRAMQITLEWAIRQSNAETGIVGIVENNLIRIMAANGYDESTLLGEIQIIVTPIIEEVIESGQPKIRSFIDAEEDILDSDFKIMDDAQAQFVIPIQREGEVIGIILLETSTFQSLPKDQMDFLLRLSDHAAIAIANAQLFLEVKAANLAKSEFVSFVSHELKTPMTSIKGYADLLAAGAVGPINDVQNNFLSTIRSNVDRMATLVSDLSDVSRIEAGRMRLEFESVLVDDVFQEIVRSSHNQLELKNQSLHVKIEDKLPNFWGDRIRIIQILTNLVSNANKYSPLNSEIHISAEQCENIWDPSGAKQVIHIFVRDHGYGISIQDQSKIFEKFFRSDDPNIREVSGTGLGLNITKTLIEMQGGKIWFESKPNEETTFHFTIPISESL